MPQEIRLEQVIFRSRTTGIPYFYNSLTNTSSKQQSEQPIQSVRLPLPWVSQVSSRGIRYFYNSQTGKSQYNTPEGTIILEDTNSNTPEVTSILEVSESLINYYIENGVPLEEYVRIITLFKQLGMISSTGYITTITEGCREPKTPDQLDKILDMIVRYSPNIISIDLGRCYNYKQHSLKYAMKLESFGDLKYVYSYHGIKELIKSEKITNISTGINSWKKFMNQVLNDLNSRDNQPDYDYIEFGFNDFDMVKGFVAQGIDFWRKRCAKQANGDAQVSLALHPPPEAPKVRCGNSMDSRSIALDNVTRILAQEAYDDYVDTLIEGNHYAYEDFPNFSVWAASKPPDVYEYEVTKAFVKNAWPDHLGVKILKFLLDKGAKPNLDILFKDYSGSTGDLYNDTELVKSYIYAQSLIIETLYRINPEYFSKEEVNKLLPPDWNSIISIEDTAEDIVYEHSYDQHFWIFFKTFCPCLRNFVK